MVELFLHNRVHFGYKSFIQNSTGPLDFPCCGSQLTASICSKACSFYWRPASWPSPSMNHPSACCTCSPPACWRPCWQPSPWHSSASAYRCHRLVLRPHVLDVVPWLVRHWPFLQQATLSVLVLLGCGAARWGVHSAQPTYVSRASGNSALAHSPPRWPRLCPTGIPAWVILCWPSYITSLNPILSGGEGGCRTLRIMI